MVLRAEAYVKQMHLDQPFLDMDAELHACVAAETSAGLGPLLPSRGSLLSSHYARTGIDTTLGRLRERPADGENPMYVRATIHVPLPSSPHVQPPVAPHDPREEDETLARRLQCEADAEAVRDLAAPSHQFSSAVQRSSRSEDDEEVARTLQLDFDAEEAAELGLGRGDDDQDGAGGGEGGGGGPSSASTSPRGAQARQLTRLEALAADAVRQGHLGLRAELPRRSRSHHEWRDSVRQPPGAISPQALQNLGQARALVSEADVLRRVLEISANQGSHAGFAVQGADAEEVATTTGTLCYRSSSDCGAGDRAGARACAEECSICKEVFEDGAELRVLPCLHRFHVACVDRWLSQSRTCPVCKHDITQ